MESKIEVLQGDCQNPVVIEMSEDTKVDAEPFMKVKTMKEDRQKKKDVKSVEHVLKALSSLNTAEEKLAAMCKKYTEIVDENRKLQQSVKHADKRSSAAAKEKEQLQLEYNKNVLLKSKLENLCRELQKQNKSVKDESLLKIREEEERRKETQAKFQTTLSEISALMRQNNEKNTELRDANIDITKKFKSVVEQYELREQQIEKMAKQMSLESQLAEAKLAKAGLEAQADREKLIAENKQLLVEIAQCQIKMQELQGTETALRSQVNMYTDKYDEFQNALTKSNEVFGGFKGEMEKMSKKITKLEKESLSWKKRWEGSHVALLDMVAEKQKSDGQTALLGRQLAQLQKLCRAMQAERSALIKTLEDNNIPRPTAPPTVPEAIPEIQPSAPNTIDKVDEMAINCAQLKQSLAQLQGQLNALSTKHTNEEENTSDTKKGKNKNKSKGKKNKEKRESPTATDANVDTIQTDECMPVSIDTENMTDFDNEECPSKSAEDTTTQETCKFLMEQTLQNVESSIENDNNTLTDRENTTDTSHNKDSSMEILTESRIEPLVESQVQSEVSVPVKIENNEELVEKKEAYERLSSTDSLPTLDTNLNEVGENLQCSAKAVAVAITDISSVIANALSITEKS